MTSQLEAKLILDAKAILGEGAIWHPAEKVLYWVDIEGEKMHRYNPQTNDNKSFAVGSRIGTIVPVQGGGALVALQNGIHRIDTDTGKLTFLNNPLKQDDIRFNDGKCDPAGRFWVGTMALDARQGGAVLYRMDTDGTIKQILDKLTISNGIAWTADQKTMYLADTPTQKIFSFDYDLASGAVTNKKVAIEIPEADGSPDGMTLDAAGNLWVALFGGGAVACYNPLSGEMLRKIKVPAPNITSCAFGGTGLATLYITSGRQGLKEEQLEKYQGSGGLFAVEPGVSGVEAAFFKGNL